MQKLHALCHGLKIRLMETSHNRMDCIVELCIPVLRQSFCEISTQNGAAAAGKAVRVIPLCHLHADSFLSILRRLQRIDHRTDLLHSPILQTTMQSSVPLKHWRSSAV